MNRNTKKAAFGWWTTGRDQAALDLFDAVYTAIEEGTIPGEIGYVFCSREPGESDHSDRLLDRIRGLAIPVVTHSAKRFKPVLRQQDRGAWRKAYHHEVLKSVAGYSVDVVVLAGYMWVVSSEVCERLAVINLHPASPGGPAGTWQEVVWRLLEQGAAETGVMMHLVTPDLDEGPPVTYCTFPIKGDGWEPLWKAFKAKRAKRTLAEIQRQEGEGEPLFAAVRREGVRRELPLIVQTLRSFATGRISIRQGKLLDGAGNELSAPFDLTEEIEETLR